MEIISVIAAAVAGFAFGAAWYMALSKQWVAASGIEVDENGQPANQSKTPFILAGIAMLLVAGMMRHTFAMSGIDTLAAGLVGGLGVGLFFISPWIMINNAYGDRPFNLTLIDGGYATFGCAVMGAVLGLL
jgi:predicted DNA repair protein MutK